MLLTLGKTLEFHNFRIHRFSNSITATDLTFANKRGKTCNEYVAYEHHLSEEVANALFNTFSDALEALDNKRADRSEVENYIRTWHEGSGLSFQHRELRGVDVAPSTKDFTPVEFESEHVRVSLNWDSFSVHDKSDNYNEPTIISNGSGSNARRLHKLWTKNKVKFEGMKFSQLHTWFVNQDRESKARIKFHFFCAVD